MDKHEATPFTAGTRVTVTEHPEHGKLHIGEDFPFAATITRTDGMLFGENAYRVTTGDGEEWSVLQKMCTPVVTEQWTFSEGDKVVVTEHAVRGTWGIGEDFPFHATVRSVRHGEPGQEVQYIVQAESGSTWSAYESMLTAEDKTPEPDERDTKIAALKAQVARLEGEVVRREREMTTLIEDAHRYADDHSLCSEFDRFMEDHGLPMREREYEVEVRFTVTAQVTVQASSEDEAQSKAEDEAMDARSDMDEAISARTELFSVDTQFDEVGDAERQD